jgi:chromosome segregation ATPase
MRQLKDLQAAKRKEADSLQATIQTLKRVYSGKTSEDKFSRLIECLESQISILKEAKSDYCQQLERIKLQPVDSGTVDSLAQ